MATPAAIRLSTTIMGSAEVFWASVLEALILEAVGTVVEFGPDGGGVGLLETSCEGRLVGFGELVGTAGGAILVTAPHVVFSVGVTSVTKSFVSRFPMTVSVVGFGLMEGALAIDFFTSGTSGLRLI